MGFDKTESDLVSILRKTLHSTCGKKWRRLQRRGCENDLECDGILIIIYYYKKYKIKSMFNGDFTTEKDLNSGCYLTNTTSSYRD